jgi:tetratricopeptide (TPR) repeat protein
MTVSYKIIQDFRTITHDMLVAYRQYLLLLVIFCAQYTYSNSSSAPSTDALFSATTAAAYQDLIREQNNGAKTADLDQILKLAEAAREANNSVTAITTILQNMPAILQQINSPQIQQVTALALSLQGIEIAKSLLSQAKDQGDNVSEARITFEIAKYYANEAHWPEVARLLKNATIIESLAKEDADEANLLIGTALQQQKKHREAMTYYEKIKSGSVHYRLAQLNFATANIRQDWWTDAHLAIQSALKINGTKKDELDYRLYTVLGFSQIQYGFYRDARESFRNVAINSEYTNRALLGLGMAALHQEDFIGALNAFNHLREKQEEDISIAESYLLGAFALRQLGQHEAALAAYQEAVAYYQQLDKKQAAAYSSLTTRPIKLSVNDSIFIRPESRNNKQLRRLFEKLNIINDLLAQPLTNSRSNTLTNIKMNLEQSYQALAQKLLSKEQESIQSYLSQSQFGLATLYDGK